MAINVERFEKGEFKYNNLNEEERETQREYLDILNKKDWYSGALNGVCCPAPDYDVIYFINYNKIINEKNYEENKTEQIKR